MEILDFRDRQKVCHFRPGDCVRLYNNEGEAQGLFLCEVSMSQKFQLGQVVMTHALNEWVQQDLARYDFLLSSLDRHHSGDWGEVCEEDSWANDASLVHGSRVLSVYSHEGTTIWIITEADRSVTTLLFPSDY